MFNSKSKTPEEIRYSVAATKYRRWLESEIQLSGSRLHDRLLDMSSVQYRSQHMNLRKEYEAQQASIVQRATEAASGLLKPYVDIHSVAEYVSVGEAYFATRSAGGINPYAMTASDLRGEYSLELPSSDAQRFPIIVPLMGRGNLVFEASPLQVQGTLRSIVCGVLNASSMAQLEIVYYDAEITGTMAPFVRAGINAAILKKSDSLGDMLNDSRNVLESNQNVSGNSAEGLLGYRKQRGSVAGVLRLNVILGLPTDLHAQDVELLSHLMRNGPKNGVSFIIASASFPTAFAPNMMADVFSLSLASPRETYIYEAPEQSRGSNVPTASLAQTGERVLVWKWSRYSAMYALLNAEIAAEAVDSLVVTANARFDREKLPPVYLGDIDTEKDMWQRSSATELKCIIGANGDTPTELVLASDGENFHHALITGEKGMGKSTLIATIIFGLCQRYAPEELQLYLMDLKNGLDMKAFTNIDKEDFLPHIRAVVLNNDIDACHHVLVHLEQEFVRRASAFGNSKSISEYRKANPQATMPRILVVIDEFQQLFIQGSSHHSEDADILYKIATQGRAYGIHLILASHGITSMSAYNWNISTFWAQFDIRLGFRNSPDVAAAVFSSKNTAISLLRSKGQAIINTLSGNNTADNRHFVVATCEAEQNTRQYRMWSAAKDYVEPPRIFCKDALAPLHSVVPYLRTMQERSALHNAHKEFIIGMGFGVSNLPATASFSMLPGNHMAIVGDANLANTSMRIGIMQTLILSLALAHQRQEVLFYVLDWPELSAEEEERFALWTTLLHSLGFKINDLSKRNFEEFLQHMADNLEGSSGIRQYIVSFNMDRHQLIDRTAQNNLAKIIQFGPSSGVHFIAAWSTPSLFAGMLGGAAQFVHFRMALNMNAQYTQTFVGNPHLQRRGTVYDRAMFARITSNATPQDIVPLEWVTEHSAKSIVEAVHKALSE